MGHIQLHPLSTACQCCNTQCRWICLETTCHLGNSPMPTPSGCKSFVVWCQCPLDGVLNNSINCSTSTDSGLLDSPIRECSWKMGTPGYPRLAFKQLPRPLQKASGGIVAFMTHDPCMQTLKDFVLCALEPLCIGILRSSHKNHRQDQAVLIIFANGTVPCHAFLHLSILWMILVWLWLQVSCPERVAMNHNVDGLRVGNKNRFKRNESISQSYWSKQKFSF